MKVQQRCYTLFLLLLLLLLLLILLFLLLLLLLLRLLLLFILLPLLLLLLVLTLLFLLLHLFFSSSSVAMQSHADPRRLNGLLPVRSVFSPPFPICNFEFINICLYTVPPYVSWSSP